MEYLFTVILKAQAAIVVHALEERKENSPITTVMNTSPGYLNPLSTKDMGVCVNSRV